ncbi:NACHT domain- and WD repeat-containing protein 1-like, partial [Saccoglossus kowalevskii]|uniref:NACHT and WD repeat domain-containing protein 1-like n=1 Tax=Saccoglossus kowalevskii TaxID=10224 RepID=A0ABM0MSU9_SACKO
MRWGVTDEAANDHTTMQLCLEEIRNCQQISTGPKFVSLLSHKYGTRPLPSDIICNEFETIIGAVDSEEDRTLMKQWYKQDTNAVPPVYILQPISSIISNFGHQGNRMLAEKTKSEWWRTYERLLEITTKAVLLSIKDTVRAHSLINSITEKEIEFGLHQSQDVSSSCLWFKREIQGLAANDKNPSAKNFVDQLDSK